MLTAGHIACGPVTAMRWLSSALSHRCQEYATSRHPVGCGCRDGHGRRRSGHLGHGHPAGDQAPGQRFDPPGPRCGRGRYRVRAHRAVRFRVRARRGGSSPGEPQEIGRSSAACGHGGRARARRAGRSDTFGQITRTESDGGVFAGRPARPTGGNPRPTGGNPRAQAPSPGNLGKLRNLGKPRDARKLSDPGKLSDLGKPGQACRRTDAGSASHSERR
jgi:hypothetical protein